MFGFRFAQPSKLKIINLRFIFFSKDFLRILAYKLIKIQWLNLIVLGMKIM